MVVGVRNSKISIFLSYILFERGILYNTLNKLFIKKKIIIEWAIQNYYLSV